MFDEFRFDPVELTAPMVGAASIPTDWNVLLAPLKLMPPPVPVPVPAVVVGLVVPVLVVCAFTPDAAASPRTAAHPNCVSCRIGRPSRRPRWCGVSSDCIVRIEPAGTERL